MTLLSIVVPSFNEEKVLEIFYSEISKEFIALEKAGAELEIIFVDDGSTDNTINIIKTLRKNDSHIRYISFSRNFGKESAIFAGLEKSKGDYVVIMDADLQDPPSMLLMMFKAIHEDGYDAVATKRVTRKGEPFVRSLFARSYYKLMRWISRTEFIDGARDFRMMRRQMVNAILSMKEYNRFIKGINEWVGFKTKWFEYENIQRAAGNTKWSFWKLFLYSLDGITDFSIVPLVMSSLFGVIFCLLSFLFTMFILLKTFVAGDQVGIWAYFASAILGIEGLQFIFLGVLGQYLAKTYLETKNRPIYITREDETTHVA
ncbi:MAG: glycosyltransferase [Candidatus Riflebacteria bacterium HGW-Riflebacteria-2]|jgi:glycosyltransferase involved in cell wall biosynthesis|nr:MAG: glycosyltransferase [Candidatus Riflebacteria bacterium HGW-Riflebacteria-2]